MFIISAQRLRECQDFIDKVGEIRFNKVKQRQLNKFNLLTIRKEGNITRSNNTNTNNLTLQAGSQVNQTTSQANPPLPGKEAFLPRQALSLPEKLAPLWQLLSHPGKEAFLPRQVLPPPGEASASPATAITPREGSIPSQASTLPPREASTSLATAILPRKGSFPSQASTLPPREASASPVTAILPGKEAVPPR